MGAGEADLDDELVEGVALLDGAGEPVGALHLGRGVGGLTVEQTDVALRLATTVATDAVRVSPLPHAIKAAVLSLADTVGLAPAAAALRAVLALESLQVGETVTPTGIFGRTATDNARVVEQLFSATPAALEDGVGTADLLAVTTTIRLVEQLGITPLLVPAARYGRTATDTLELLDSLARFFSGDLEDTVGTADLLAGSAQAFAAAVDTLGIEAVLAPTLVLRVVASDTVGIDPEQLERMLFAPVVDDGVEITAGYIAPDGGLTTWVVNARTGVVTEYDNFEFNSFALLGPAYIGASSEGLFELLGDTDDGTAIVPRIKSGFMKFGAMKLSSIRSAYIGIRGDGDFVLRITTGDGKTYDYAAKPQNMRTTRVRMGKGLRASYFAFELVGDGADFDLDAIEFVPLVNKRRV